MRGTHALQRRLLRRVDVDGITVQWNVHAASSSWIRSGSTTWQEALVTNASVGGACVVAPRDLELTTGSAVVIREGEIEGLVSVRWVKAADDPRLMLYGVSYIDVEPDLIAFLMDTAGARSSTSP